MKDFFKEGTQESMVRLLSFLCVLNSIALSFSTYQDKLALIGMFLGAGMTSKVAQKIIENKEKKE